MSAEDSATVVVKDGLNTVREDNTASPRSIGRGDAVDRYVVIEQIGAGAMGVVYAALDPDLNRKVAIKLLKPYSGDDGHAHTRMLREAQAMARLNHRSVVAVHDVGTFEDQVFIAMEFVAGRTLREWQAEKGRTWSDILRMYIRAGEGLAAAHAAGVVHRDFKPDNVMVSPRPDGRDEVRVLDFGLAREGGPTLADGRRTVSGSTSGPLASGLTQTGTMVGTPAYMAPEGFIGQSDDLSDQFSFCASLYHGLYGERPFPGNTIPEIRRTVSAGELRDEPSGSAVPGWLRAVVLRGLDPERSKRYPSMRKLLRALKSDPTRRRRRLLLIGVGTVGLGGAAAAAALLPSGTERMCQRGASRIAEVWNPQRRETIAGSFASVDVPHAVPTWAKAAPILDRYAESWAQAYERACRATHVDGSRSGEALDASMACLARHLDQLDAAAEEFEQVDETLAGRAINVAARLPDNDGCDDPRRGADPLTDPAAKERLARAQQALARAMIRHHAGRYESGLAVANEALLELGDLDVPSARAEALLLRGQLERKSGNVTGAEATIREALDVAITDDVHEVAAAAWLEILFTITQSLGEPERGLPMLLPAELAVKRSGDALLEVRLHHNAMLAYSTAGKRDKALEHGKRALELADRADAPLLTRGAMHNGMSGLLYDMARYEESLAHSEVAVELAIEAQRGDDHPEVASNLHNLGRIYQALGRYDDARQTFQRTIDIRRRTLGPDHSAVGDSVAMLAVLESSLTNYDASRRLGEQALAIYEKSLPPNHPYVAIVHNNLGMVDGLTGKLDDALAHYETALEIDEAHYGKDHASTAAPLNNIGQVQLRRNKPQEALASFERALAIEETSQGPDHPEVTYPLLGMSEAYVALGQPDRAVAAADRARRINETAGGEPTHQSATYLALAEALDAAGRDRNQIRKYAQLGLDTWAKAGVEDLEHQGKLEALLR